MSVGGVVVAGGRVLGLLAVVVLVAIVGVLVALAVIVRRLTQVVADTGRAVDRLSTPVAAIRAPIPAAPDAGGPGGTPSGDDGPGDAEDEMEWVVEVTDGVEAEPPTVHRPTAGPRLSEVAAATLGPPLVRAAALGYGIRTVLADRGRPRPEPRRGLFGAAGGSRAARDRARRRASRGRR